MRDQERNDVLVALAVGAVIGIGAALLMRGDDLSRREKLLREIRPLTKRARQGARVARDQAGRGAGAAVDAADALRGAGRDVVTDLRDEIASLVGSAGAELRRTARRTVRDTRRTLRNLR